MDENVKMSESDIKKFKNHTIINSTDRFECGTPDEVLTKVSKENGWIIVTKDIRMALRSLIDDVPVIYIGEDPELNISFLKVHIYSDTDYPEMFAYIKKRFGYATS